MQRVRKHPIRWIRVILIALVPLMIGVSIYLIITQNSNELSTPSWHGITPGHTTAGRLVKLLGEPDRIEQRSDYQIYSYDHRKDLGGWRIIEAWIRDKGDEDIIFAIYRSNPYFMRDGKLVSIADIHSLSQLLSDFGKPESVTWSTHCCRYLIWAEQGIAASVDPLQYLLFGWEINVYSVLLFEPMLLGQFQQANLPWNYYLQAIVMEPTCYRSDTYPEDPFNWEQFPTPNP
jgi:hypothetical protein